MWNSSSIPTTDARAIFFIRHSIRPVVHCHQHSHVRGK
jgi:hypothetical protein